MLANRLTDQDREILRTLARVRVATAVQLEQLHCVAVTRRQFRGRLTTLTGQDLITRLPRVIGGVRSGSAGYVYALGIAGQKLLHPDERRPQRPWPVGLAFLAHSLAVTELYVGIKRAEHLGELTLGDFTTEPACWRSYVGPGGARVVLKPDAAGKLWFGEFEDHWLIEVDLGTESTTAIARKADRYRQYWQSGAEEANTGVHPRTLWLVPDERRRAALVEVLGRQPAESWRLHTVVLFEEAITRLTQGAGS
ncbi:replication-relaxation family protein [Luedemannella flava]|uniref:replication-relaxation family protein n=1 Tax=Luedemannella flava TaxID=349316 RepID=UPI0031D3DDA5